MKQMRDSDRFLGGAGDKVEFKYGIPPVRVIAEVVDVDGELIAMTPGHTPEECPLRDLRRAVGDWYWWRDK